MVGAEVEFIFSEEWEPLIKTAVFIAGSEKRVVLEAAWRDNICTIPHECLAGPDVHLSVGVYGTNAAGSLVIPTVYADLGMIWTGTDPDGESGAEASPELWAQLQAQLDLKESPENKVTSLSEASTDEQYPSAKAVYEALTASGTVVIEGTVSPDASAVTITTPDAWSIVYEAWSSDRHPPVVLRLTTGIDEAAFYAYLICVIIADVDVRFALFSLAEIAYLDNTPPYTITLNDNNTAEIEPAIDTSMSDTSGAAVQNKVVKKYIDDNAQPKGDYALRSELFSGSYDDLTDKPEIPNSKPFVVTVTYSDGGNFTADKTHEEIVVAYASGEQINAKIVNYPNVTAPAILPLYMNRDNIYFTFSGAGVLANGIAMTMTAMDYNGTWTINLARLANFSEIPDYLPNPKALTVKVGNTTVTYDGSEAKTVEIADGSEVSY